MKIQLKCAITVTGKCDITFSDISHIMTIKHEEYYSPYYDNSDLDLTKNFVLWQETVHTFKDDGSGSSRITKPLVNEDFKEFIKDIDQNSLEFFKIKFLILEISLLLDRILLPRYFFKIAHIVVDNENFFVTSQKIYFSFLFDTNLKIFYPNFNFKKDLY